MSWSAGATGGSPITNFTVTDHTQGDSKSCGAVTQCLFDGRTNGTEHTFSVTATNEVGESDPSNKTSVLIDGKPETPGAPTAKPGNGSITVSWTAPSNDGSPIEGYDVELSPGGTQSVGANETSLTISGLTNGNEYQVRVRARNRNYTSEWSPYSPSATPYGAPGAPSGVSAAFSNGTAQVKWNAPSDTNGRDIEYYEVSAGAATPVRVSAPLISTSIDLGYSEQQVSISVVAVNDTKDPGAHTSPAATTTVWAVGDVNAPTITSVAATGNSREVRIGVEFQPGNGWSKSDVTRYQWAVSGSGDWNDLPKDGGTVTSTTLTDGTAATIKVRVDVRKGGDGAESSAEATGGTVTPFGPPATPTVWCEPGGPDWVDCHWSGATNGGRPAQLVMTGNDPKTIDLTDRGDRPFNVGKGNSAQLCVKTVQTSSELGTRESGQQCARATARRFAVEGYQGGPGECKYGSCGPGSYRKQGLRLTDWRPSTAVRCSMNWDGSPASVTVTTDHNGNWAGEPSWNYKGINMYLVQALGSDFVNVGLSCQ